MHSGLQTLLLSSFFLVAGCSAAGDSGAGAVSSADEDLTIATASKCFTTQWGPTRFNSVAGAPDGYDDCGPTSLYMAACTQQDVPPSSPSGAEDVIRYMRNLTRGGVETPKSSGTPGWMMMQGFAGLRQNAQLMAPTVAAIEDALARHSVVVLAGDPGDAWGRTLDQAGHYLHRYDQGWGDKFGHWVVVYARAVDHVQFVIGDPLSTIGPIKVTAETLGRYLTCPPTETDCAIEVSRP